MGMGFPKPMHFPILTKKPGKALAGINTQNVEHRAFPVNELQVHDSAALKQALNHVPCELLLGVD